MARPRVARQSSKTTNVRCCINVVVDVILRPLHPLGVWFVGVVMPPLRTLVSNMPTTHLDAD